MEQEEQLAVRRVETAQRRTYTVSDSVPVVLGQGLVLGRDPTPVVVGALVRELGRDHPCIATTELRRCPLRHDSEPCDQRVRVADRVGVLDQSDPDLLRDVVDVTVGPRIQARVTLDDRSAGLDQGFERVRSTVTCIDEKGCGVLKVDNVGGHVAMVRRFGDRVVVLARSQCVSADAQRELQPVDVGRARRSATEARRPRQAFEDDPTRSIRLNSGRPDTSSCHGVRSNRLAVDRPER